MKAGVLYRETKVVAPVVLCVAFFVYAMVLFLGWKKKQILLGELGEINHFLIKS